MKRSPAHSPISDEREVKKLKVDDVLESDDSIQDKEPTHSMHSLNDRVPSTPPVVEENALTRQSTKDAKTKVIRHAGEGFRPWKPKAAYLQLPNVLPHWGIVPRNGRYRPSELQPPARTSDAAVRPALWENRKGAVRLKRGERFIDGYDQAYHMWLPLMNLRPFSQKNQTPQRKPIGYYYQHGMPIDWNDTGAINDLNKGLQEAVKVNSNKELPYSVTERSTLAQLFAADHLASIWDIAERFNDSVYPIPTLESEEGKYPTGRFIESICHEYLIYKSTYDKGEAPTESTEKDVYLEKLWLEKKIVKKISPGIRKTVKNTPSQKMSDNAGVTKPKHTCKNASKKRPIGQMNPAFGFKAVQLSELSLSMAQQPPLSAVDEELLEIGGAYDTESARPSSPLSPRTHVIVNSPSYGKNAAPVGIPNEVSIAQVDTQSGKSLDVNKTEHLSGSDNSVTVGSGSSGNTPTIQRSFFGRNQIDSVVPIMKAMGAVSRGKVVAGLHTGVISQETQVAAATGPEAVPLDSINVSSGSAFVEKAARDTEVDEDYDEFDDILED